MEESASDLSEARGLIKAIQEQRERMNQNQQVPVDELRLLVFVAYSCSMISIGRAYELFCTDLLDFRQQWNEWAKENPRMLEIFDNYDPYKDC